ARRRRALRTRRDHHQRLARERTIPDRIGPGRQIDDEAPPVIDRDLGADLTEDVEVPLERVGDPTEAHLHLAVDRPAADPYPTRRPKSPRIESRQCGTDPSERL